MSAQAASTAAFSEEVQVVETETPAGDRVEIRYQLQKVIGQGSFGVVMLAQDVETNEQFAIKKVLQDRRYKNRELSIQKMLSHPNVVSLKYFFYSSKRGETGAAATEGNEDVFLNLLLEYVPETMSRVTRHYARRSQTMPLIFVKLFSFQLCRAVAYLHSLGVCHRDLKPQNVLVNTETGVLKLCDLGSAKILEKGQPNVSYICSRYYRAPELIFGSTSYSTDIDTWSLGCVLAELFTGTPLFPGESGVDQLVEVIKVLGTPSKADIKSLNSNYQEFKFPKIKPYPWRKVFRRSTPAEAVDLISRMLVYDPAARLTPFEALAHPFFDDLRDPATTLPDGRPLPELFNFSDQELSVNPSLLSSILPQETVG